jgi:hypothetical protein
VSTKIWLDEWVARKRREIAAEEPLSIQTNIAALSQRLWKAEQTLEQVRRFVDTAGFPDDTPSRYGQGYNDARNDVARILDGGDA